MIRGPVLTFRPIALNLGSGKKEVYFVNFLISFFALFLLNFLLRLHRPFSLNSNGSEFHPVCDTRCGQRERGQRAAALESSRSFYLRVAGGGLGRSPFPPAKEGKRLPYVRSGGGWGVLVEKRCPRRRPRDMCMYVYVYVCKCICMYMHMYVYVYVCICICMYMRMYMYVYVYVCNVM